MIKVAYKQTDQRYIFLTGDSREVHELEKHLNKIPSYMYMPSFAGIPKPEVFLNRFTTKSGITAWWCHSGLYREIQLWCEKNHISLTGIDRTLKYTGFSMSYEDFCEYVDGWNLNIQLRSYQLKAAWLILKYKKSLSQLCTRSGKTAIGYVVFRTMLEKMGAHKILMIVPSIQLVKQGVQDMSEYQEFFKAEQIWAKAEYCDSPNLIIGTFQSLVKRADPKDPKFDAHFFDGIDVVLCDEAHKLPCKSINTILCRPFMKDVKLRFGFTGTLPQTNTIEWFSCQAMMGPQIQDLTTMELVKEGFLVPPNITQIRLTYPWKEVESEIIKCGEYLCSNSKLDAEGKKIMLPKEQQEFTIKEVKTLPYALKEAREMYETNEYGQYLIDLCRSRGANLLMLEQMLVHRSQKRIQEMDNLISNMTDGNCIVLAHHTEYIKYLVDHFTQTFPDKKVVYIVGSVNLKKRQKILDQMLENNNVILVGSFGCISTGITFKNVNYAIFAQSFKSDITIMQSIGRGLLPQPGKDAFYIYDIIDDFPSHQLLAQGKSKIKSYQKQGFTYTILE
jgi:superfamily II DNA or RNA helicase